MRPPAPFAVGRSVQLRRKHIDDAYRDWVWRTDDEISTLDAVPISRLSLEEFREQMSWQLKAETHYRNMFAIETVEGRHIGNILLYNVDQAHREAELGIIIGEREFWGSGAGREAVTLLVDHAFTTMPLTRIYLHTLDWNERAQRAFASAGFRMCGIVRRGPNRFHLMEVRREWLWDRDYQRKAAQPVQRGRGRGRRAKTAQGPDQGIR